MADIANKYAENVPANFMRSDEGGYSYVFKQPTTPEEEALCKEAMEGCPVEAIGTGKLDDKGKKIGVSNGERFR